MPEARVAQVDARVEEVGHAGIGGCAQVGGRPERDEPAAHEDADAVGDAEGEVAVVGNHDRGHVVLLPQGGDDLGDGGRHDGVELAGRLVVEHELRLHHERAGDGDALAHPAGQLGREFPRGVLERKDLEGAHHLVADHGLRAQTVLARVKREVVVHRHRVEQRARLENQRHAHESARGRIGGVVSVDAHPAGARALESHDVLEQHALARAAGAHEHEDLSRADGQRDVAQHPESAEVLRQALDGDADGGGTGSGGRGDGRGGGHLGFHISAFVRK